MAISIKSLALIPLFLFFYSCSGIDYHDHVFIDATSADCTCILEQVLHDTKEKLGIKNDNDRTLNGHTLRVVQINDSDRYGGKVLEASLPVIKNSSQMYPTERLLEQNKYLEEAIPRMITAACTPPRESMDSTFLYSPLFENLRELSQSEAEVKSATIYSDAIPNDGKVSMYSVPIRQNPTLLLAKKDSFIRLIDFHYSPPRDLRNITVILRHKPVTRDQDFHHYARIIMDTIMTRRGADFHIEVMVECDFEEPPLSEEQPELDPRITENPLKI